MLVLNDAATLILNVDTYGERRASARLRGEDLDETLPHRTRPPVGIPLDLHASSLAPPGSYVRRASYRLAERR